MVTTRGERMQKDNKTDLEYRINGKFRMPCKLIDGNIEEGFVLHLFSFPTDNRFTGPEEHFHVITLGEIKDKKNVLLRIESACTYAHLYGSQLCDCQYQLQHGLKRISEEGEGLYIYCLDQHGRGVGIVNHVKGYQTEQEMGLDTVDAHLHLSLPADARRYEPIIAILKYFGIRGVRIMTNNPNRLDILKSHGIPAERIPHEGPLNRWNRGELKTKKEKLGHLYSYRFSER